MESDSDYGDSLAASDGFRRAAPVFARRINEYATLKLAAARRSQKGIYRCLSKRPAFSPELALRSMPVLGGEVSLLVAGTLDGSRGTTQVPSPQHIAFAVHGHR